MKELSIEQKAKAYEEALERARKIHTQTEFDYEKGLVEEIFPELKESEDGEIRKMLIKVFSKGAENNSFTNGISDKDILVWLEKQSDKDRLIKELGEYKVKYTQEVLEKLINSMSNKDGERLRKTTIAFLKDFAEKGYENAVECIDWLEKQGEQNKWKPSKEEMDALYGLAYITNKIDDKKDEALTRLYQDLKREFFNGVSCENMFPSSHVTNIDGEKQSEQKPTDNAVPKYHKGEWVTCAELNAARIISIVDDFRYEVEFIDGRTFFPYIDYIDKDFHRWTIKDAKDGDVLAFDDDTIVLFKDLYNKTSFHSYCHIEEGVFTASEEDVPDWWQGKGFEPATKEQRDTLMKAISDAGYTFDSEKKELRKIEPDVLIEESYQQQADDIIDIVTEKSTWSEEDEKILQSKHQEISL